MKVFLSWSGNRSKEVANFLSDWLCCVIQASRPWISARDLDRGSLWFGEINDQLKETSVGVICLTQENKNRPWILFEAGALAKGLSTARVCTFLVDIEPKDIEDPLAQFNHTFPTREGVLSLVRTLNSTLGQGALDTRVLEQVFDTYWPQFEKKFKEILSRTEAQAPSKPRPNEEVLSEILNNTRSLNSRLLRLEREVDHPRPGTEVQQSYMRLLRRQVNDLMLAGLPIEAVVERLSTEYPRSAIAEVIDRALVERPIGNG